MRLVAQLCWFDELNVGLERVVEDLAMLGVTHLVAVDGPYEIYPHEGRSRSGIGQVVTLDAACADLGLELVLYRTARPWAGNEVEKRQTMMDIALSLAGEDGYVFPWDADFELVRDATVTDMKLWLAGHGDPLFAEVRISESGAKDSWYWIRQFIRAREWIRFTTNHYTYHFPDGTSTVVGPLHGDLDRGVRTNLKVLHRQTKRPDGRREKQILYYERRHEMRVET